MLFLVSQSNRRRSSVAQVARELNLIIKTHAGHQSLAEHLRAKTRRIACLAVEEIDAGSVEAIAEASLEHPLGLIVCGSRAAFDGEGGDSLLAQVENLENVTWIRRMDDVDELRHAARICWQRMLRVTHAELRDAIANDELVIQYQPKVERTSGAEWRTREAESLLRWRHPEHGLLGPLEFLPEAEAFGLMGAITELVLSEAAIQLGRWERQGLVVNACINLAPSLLRDKDIASTFALIVREHGQECSRFTFEVPENDVANSEAPHLRALQTLRGKGFRISLDDFGVAASSLSAFEQMPFDEIKIHAAALRRAKASPVAQQVLAAVTGLAHKLGIAVCAEGVEDQETYQFLQTIGCDKMQGFLISEAVMPDIIKLNYLAGEDVEDVA